MNSIELVKKVNNWCLGEKLLRSLPPGVYYLTIAIQWNGPKEGPKRIALIKEEGEGRFSGMTIEDDTTFGGLKAYAESVGFQPVDDPPTVYKFDNTK